ncbi:MAG: glycosyltransferase family 1 protein [Calditrichaeota bacterium]|nr:MAG: glycosyltransferase family 1 protein [Calditrichota bacterium]
METEALRTLQLISVRWWNASAYYGVSLTEALNKAGVYSIAGGRENSPPIQKACQFQVPVYSEIDLETFHPLKAIANLKKLKRFVTHHKISLINGHRAEDGLYGVMVKKTLPYPLPVIRTGSDVRAPKNHPLNRWLYQHGLDHIIFSCKASYERFQSVWNFFDGKSSIIYSAIDTDEFQPQDTPSRLRERYGIGKDKILIGIIARLSPVKDHFTFLRAAAIVSRQFPDAHFLISGENAQLTHDDLKKFASQLGIRERILFLPRTDSITVKELIHALDIGVVASNGSEVICRVSVEYMAMGKPQVVTNINVLPEIVEDGQNGLVVPAGDFEAMAKALLILIQNPELRQKMGQTARRYAVEKFSYPVFAEKTLTVYRKVLHNSR